LAFKKEFGISKNNTFSISKYISALTFLPNKTEGRSELVSFFHFFTIC
jgi:hypothetical protein